MAIPGFPIFASFCCASVLRKESGEIINIQPDGNKAKPYQVKQIRNLLVKYRIGGVEDD